jgi:murein DD-endopeptidase MepM/ murein hydrolase activator NlpD
LARGLVAGLVGVALVGGLTVVVGPAPAVTAAPTTVAEVQDQLNQSMAEQADLDRQISDLNQSLTTAQSQLAQTQAQITQQSAAIASLETEVTQIALQQWQNRGVDFSMTVLASQDIGQALSQLTTGQWVASTTTSLLDRYRQEKEVLSALETSETQAVTQIQADQATVSSLAAQADQKVQAGQRLLTQLSSQELQSLNDAVISTLDPSQLKSSAGLIKPVNGPVTSPFGYRNNPISGLPELHDGTDYGAACQTPVLAAASGTVTYVGYYGGFGNRVMVDHGFINGHDYVTAYNHLSAFAVANGATVQQGQVIAYVGSTGYSTGCHLHLSMWIDGELANPDQWVSGG